MIDQINDKAEDELVYCLDSNGLLQIIEAMQKFPLFSKDDLIVQSYTDHVACKVD